MIAPVSPAPPAQPPVPPLIPGSHVLMGRNALGTWIEGPRGGADFSHRWTVHVSGDGARVGFGLVMANVAVEPRIGRVPVSGTDKQPQPVLKLNPALKNDKGESWVCVEVTPNADGALDAGQEESQVVVVQRDHPIAMVGETGRAPLALLFYGAGDRPQVHQVAMFHFRYETAVVAGRRRHFFL